MAYIIEPVNVCVHVILGLDFLSLMNTSLDGSTLILVGGKARVRGISDVGDVVDALSEKPYVL